MWSFLFLILRPESSLFWYRVLFRWGEALANSRRKQGRYACALRFSRVSKTNQPHSQGLLRFQDGPQPPLAMLRPRKNFARAIHTNFRIARAVRYYFEMMLR